MHTKHFIQKMRTLQLLFICLTTCSAANLHSFAPNTGKDSIQRSPRHPRSTTTYVADELGRRVVVMISSLPTHKVPFPNPNISPSQNNPNGFNRPLGSTVNHNFGNNREGGGSKYPGALAIIEALRLLGVPNLPDRLHLFPPPSEGDISFPGGDGGGGIPTGPGLSEAALCSLLGRCVEENNAPTNPQ